MNLYLVSQDLNNGYDTYDSVVVSAESEDDARSIHPSIHVTHVTDNKWYGIYSDASRYSGKGYCKEPSYDWVDYKDIDKLKVKLLGASNIGRGVVLASFNAG